MKTLKEIKEGLEINSPLHNAYSNGYQTAIEGIYNDIRNAETSSVETIEKYLQNLLNK